MNRRHSAKNLPSNVNVAPDVTLGEGVRLSAFVNLYGCTIGNDSRLGAFVEIQRDARIGARCKISSHTFVCSGVEIEDEVFVGHGVVFINDRYPRATNSDGSPQSEADWHLERTTVRKGASIGSGAIIMCGVEIGERAIVGAGAVVTRNVPPDAVVAGCPARLIRVRGCDDRMQGILAKQLSNPINGADEGRGRGQVEEDSRASQDG
jgi:UDP-2-acetamido-3-amino-2,3-dideoxy-glucuronate N-acetyltransferase